MRVIAAIILLLLLLFILFSIPAVQTFIGKKVTDSINETYKTNINVDKVDLSYFGTVALKDVFVKDYKQDSLIYIRSLETSILDYKNLYEGKLLFDDISLDGLTFIIKTYKGSKDSNLDVFIEKLEAGDTLPRTEPSKFLLQSSNIYISDSKFKYIDENLSNPQVLDFKELNAHTANFEIQGSNVKTDVKALSFYDKRGVRVTDIKTNFSYTLTQMRFDELNVTSEYSNVKGQLVFDYNRVDFRDFNNKVKLSANLKGSKIALREVNRFYNEFGENQIVYFDSNLSGTLNDFTAKNLKLTNKKRTRINGNVRFKNLFAKSDDFYVEGNYRNLASDYYDLKAILPDILGHVFPTSFAKLGQFNITGNSIVTNEVVTADIDISTAIGEVSTTMEMDNIDDIDNASYEGNVVFNNFDLGKFLDDSNFGTTTLNLDVKGSGFLKENVDTFIKGNISKFSFNQYTYKNAVVNGKIQDQLFEGLLNVKDENIDLEFKGLANLATVQNEYNFTANIKDANLKELNLFERDSIAQFSGDIIMDFKGSNIDDAYGVFEFKNTHYTNQNKKYSFKDFKVTSTFDDDKTRHIVVDAPNVLEGKINGKFKFKDLGKLILNSAGSVYTNYKPVVVGDNQFMDFNFNIHNQLVDVFYPELKLGDNTRLKGRVGSNEKDFKLTFKTAYIQIDENRVDQVNFQIDNKNPLFNTYVSVDKFSSAYYDIEGFKLINKTLNDTLFFKTEFVGGKNKNDKYDLSLYHTINNDNKSVLGFKKSKINFNTHDWVINRNNGKQNRIIFNNDLSSVKFDDLKISHEDALITMNGIMENDTEKDISVKLENIDLKKITPEIDSLKLAGMINGNVHVFQEKGKYYPKSSLAISDFSVNDTNLGVLSFEATGNDELSNYQINSSLENDNLKSFIAQGNIDFSNENPEMNMDTYFEDFDISVFSALGEDVITNIRGKVTGGANAIGSLENPDLIGILYLEDAGLTIPYLNIDFDFENNASVSLSDKRFLFNNIAILDTKHYTSGRVNGFIEHKSFTDWILGLNISTNNLLVLDTELEEDSLYYGTAFISGEADIKGPTDALVIDVTAQTQKGTTFKIPIRDSESVGDNSFIRFISKEEKEAQKKGQQVVFEEVEGLELNFDLDVTRDAEIEIVIDKKSGSTLRGRGAGNLLVEINTNGKFKMYGDFVTYQGTYNFIYGGLIEKRFRVLPGGTINWEGDPFAAQLDINAVYSTEANPAILLDNSTINRKIPVDVVINLTNQLLQPDVNFNINFPKTSSVVKSELQYKLQDKENRELQALSLVTSGSFVNQVSIASGTVVGNLTERAESLINDIFADEDAKFTLGVNYEQGNRSPDSDIRTDDRLGVTLSTKISDRVLINGKVGVPVGGVNETVIIGDVEIEFLLNEEGTLRAKVFNRENDFQALGFGEEIGYTQGVGLSYQVDFDSFKELLKKIFKKAEEQDQKDKSPIDDNSIPDFINFKE